MVVGSGVTNVTGRGGLKTAEYILSRLTAVGDSDLYGHVWVGKDYSKAGLVADLRAMTGHESADTLAERKRCAAIARGWVGDYEDRGSAVARKIAEEIPRGS